MRFRAAVAQVRAASSTPDAVERVASVAREARAENAELVVFPEALLGDYPRGAPDSRWIVFASDLTKGGNPAVYIMRTDGSRLQRVSHSKLWDSAADWGSAPLK